MKAVRVHKFGKPEVLTLEDGIPIPQLGEDQVLVKVTYSGINPVDTYIREGNFGERQMPFVIGYDGAGIVDDVGKGVQNFKKGDRVFFGAENSGSAAEFTVCEKRSLFPLSNKLTFQQGAALYIPYFTAHRALILKCKAKSGEILLVHGASGGVGTAAVQIGKAYGMTVVGTAGTPEGIEMVKKVGADFVFNHRSKGYLSNAVAAIGGLGFDVVLENLANVNLGEDLKVLKQKARVVVVGSRGSVQINPMYLMGTESLITGVAVLSASEEETTETAQAILKGIDEGWVNPIIDHEYSMKEMLQAHKDIIHSKGAKGKLVVKVS